MLDLEEIAARLEDDERLMLRYRVRVVSGEESEWVVRCDPLLDVAEDRGILFVKRDGEPVYVLLDEAIEVLPAAD